MTDFAKSLLYEKIIALTEISEKSLECLFQIISQKELLKGEYVLTEGMVCSTIFFVEKGYLRTFINKDGIEINSNFTLEGNFTTNLKSLRSSSASDTFIQAGEPTIIFEFDKDKLLNLYKLSPEIESFGRKLLEELLIDQEEHSTLFKIYSATERYNYIFQNKPYLLQRISLTHLATYLGLTRETLTRIRSKKL